MTAPVAKRPSGFVGLRSFLRRATPSHVVVHTELGDRTLQCKSEAWRELAESIVSLKPHGVIEAYDAKNLLLKTFDCNRIDREQPELVAMSAQQSDMMLFQKLIAEAYRHANEVAFMQVVRLVEIAFKRLEQIEVSWAKLHRQRTAELERAEGEEPEEDGAQAVLASLANGVIQGALAKPTPSLATNGAKPKGGTRGAT